MSKRKNIHPRRPLMRLFGRWTSAWRRLPEFIIIGTQKGGTTSLFDYLAQHPGISMANRKETHFFDKNYQKGLSFYKGYFPMKFLSRGKMTGEATPYYVFYPPAAPRIKAELPDIKLIVLLRDPVDRAFSSYNTRKWHENETANSFEEAIALEEERLKGEREKMEQNPDYYSWNYRWYSYLARGIYADQLEHYFQYFDKSNILILNSEDYFKDHLTTLKKVYEFLGVPYFEPTNLEVKNSRKAEKINPETRLRLKEYFRPHNERLFELLGERYNWND